MGGNPDLDHATPPILGPGGEWQNPSTTGAVSSHHLCSNRISPQDCKTLEGEFYTATFDAPMKGNREQGKGGPTAGPPRANTGALHRAPTQGAYSRSTNRVRGFTLATLPSADNTGQTPRGRAVVRGLALGWRWGVAVMVYWVSE